LHALVAARGALGLSLFAVHVHHGMRAEGEADVAFLADCCRRWRVPLGIQRENIPVLAAQTHVTLEEAGRDARYAAFFRHARAFRCGLVATAHTQDDQAETVLLNLLRGTGTDGLAGIPPRRPLRREVPEVEVIRPLLYTSRREVEAYCAAHNLQPRHDMTNEDLRHRRNQVRHTLLPLLEQFHPGTKERLAETAAQTRADVELLRQQAAALYVEALLPLPLGPETVASLDAALLAERPASLVRRALLLTLDRLGVEADRGAQERLLALVYQDGKPFDLPGGQTRARREGEQLLLERAHPTLLPTPEETAVTLSGITYLPGFGLTLEVQEGPTPLDPRCPPEQIYLDIAHLYPPLLVRPPHTGDRFHPLGAPGTRLLSDLFIDRKVPRERRASWPVLCDAEGIIWVVGLAVAERVRVTAATTSCLRITAIGQPAPLHVASRKQ
jgi:tRNA(Ile)-lysidine synthase